MDSYVKSKKKKIYTVLFSKRNNQHIKTIIIILNLAVLLQNLISQCLPSRTHNLLGFKGPRQLHFSESISYSTHHLLVDAGWLYSTPTNVRGGCLMVLASPTPWNLYCI